LHERALALRGKRLEVLAANIANADTPGYKAVDIDVEAALRAGETAETVQVKYRIPLQPSIDGNTVEMEAERAQFADAAVRYQFSLDRALKHYMHISELLKDLKE
jgi:flagellar basal body rod protein FlgB